MLYSNLRQVMEQLRVAEGRSKCQRAHVGCVLTNKRYEPLTTGYNFNPDRDSCDDPTVQGGCGCLHAEVAAAMFYRWRDWEIPAAAFVSRAPCGPCARVLAGLGVLEVYYFEDSHPMEEGFAVFKARDILYGKLPRIGE